MQPTPRLVRKLKRNGIVYPVRTVLEARRAGIALSLACALLDQESGGGHNVFGHDPTIFAGAGAVTRAKYLTYKTRRGTTHMQGVGPCQLTWWQTQDAADKLGGCWRPAINMRVGFAQLAANVKAKGLRAGAAAYNGAGPAAAAYATQLLERQARWHALLTS